MTEQDDNFEGNDEGTNEGNAPKELRKQLDKIKKQLADKETELTALKSTERARSLAETLTAKGVNPKVAKFVPSDIEGDDAISKWLTDNADAFNFTINDPKINSDNLGEKPKVSQDDINATRKLQNLNNNSQNIDKYDTSLEKINSASTDDEIAAALKEAIKYL